MKSSPIHALTLILPLIFGGLASPCHAGDSEAAEPWGPQPEITPPAKRASPELLPFRSWQLLNDDDLSPAKIRAAADYGINNIQLSHDLVMFAHKLLKQPERIERFNKYIEIANGLGMSVDLWTHEFAGLPEEITRQDKWFDRPEVWELLDARYDALFKAMPGLNGVVLTFHETEIMVFDVESEKPLHERVAMLINRLHATLKRHGKTLVVRTFAYEPNQEKGVSKAFESIDPEVILMLKCVPHDWQVFYPHNHAIGKYPERKQIIEFDPGAEYYGVGRVPYLYPEYIRFRLDYARARNAHGYVARIERHTHPSAIPGITEDSGWNAINLYAFKRFAEDTTVTPDQVWQEFVSKEVGAGAHVAPLIEALKLTDDVLNRCYFMLGCWYGDHSRLPSEGYGRGHIRFITKWHPAYKDLVSRLDKPDSRAVGEVMRESATAVDLAREALAKLEASREAGLGEAHYKRYRHQLTTLLETAETWAEHRNTFIRNRSGGLDPSYDGPFPVGGPPRHPITPSSP